MITKYKIRLFSISLLCIVFFVSCNNQQTPKDDKDKQPADSIEVLKEQEAKNKNELSIPERKPVVMHVKKDLDLDVKGYIDLTSRKADLSYDIRSRFKQPQKLDLKPQLSLKDSLQVTIKENEQKRMEVAKELDLRQLTPNTYITRVRPYMLLKEESTDYKILSGNYNSDIQFKLPKNARLIKSSVALTKVDATTYALKLKNVPMLPAVDIWYTTAKENISISKTINRDSDPVEIKLVITNNSPESVSNIQLSAEFPNAVLQPYEDGSDGKFILQDGVMYKWYVSIKNLSQRSPQTIRFYLSNANPNIPFREPEIVIHNKQGDLIELE